MVSPSMRDAVAVSAWLCAVPMELGTAGQAPAQYLTWYQKCVNMAWGPSIVLTTAGQLLWSWIVKHAVMPASFSDWILNLL